MKEKMVKLLNEKGIKVEEERFEKVFGENETFDGMDNILVYDLDEGIYMIYESTNNIYHQKGFNVERI